MATLEQKQELIDVLKFTPMKVQMVIQGYGGEAYAGRVDRQIYEYFKSRKLDISEYASDWDNSMKVPDNMQPFPAGSAYDCDGMFHASGAELTDMNSITIYDEKGDVIWEHNMDWSSLEDDGVVVEECDNVDFDDLEQGEVVFWGGQGEKGCFFDCEFILTQPFDPSKLKIMFDSCDGWQIVNFVEYDNEELDGSGGYSTTGKWAEAKWVLGGDEEVYEPAEFDSAAEDVPVLEGEEMWAQEAIDNWDPTKELDKIWEDQKTDWFDKDINPEHKGQYEVAYDAVWPNSGMGMADWTGRNWKQDGKKITILKWRGLKFNPNEVQ